MPLLLASLLCACSDYGLEKGPPEPEPGGVDSADTASPAPQVSLSPPEHALGSLVLGDAASVDLTLANVGEAPLDVRSLRLSSGAEFTLDPREDANGPLPWRLGPGERRPLTVRYVPVDTTTDSAMVLASTNDPRTPEATARQTGMAQPFPGFSTGWYIVDDPTIRATDDPAHRVDSFGDPDGYWYEPSGQHGLLASTDPTRDFAALAQWVRDRAGAPVPVTGPLNLRTSSNVPRLGGATFAYVLCDFWLPPTDDSSLYELAVDDVDDGLRVIVDGSVLGDVPYASGGAWRLDGLAPGAVHTLVVILQDNARVDKYLLGLRFTRAGVIVSG